jgi:hypothetical protein
VVHPANPPTSATTTTTSSPAHGNSAPHFRVIGPGEFEVQHHYYPRALNAHLHPIVASFLALGNERICARYSHLNPQVRADSLRALLAYQPRHFLWAGRVGGRDGMGWHC